MMADEMYAVLMRFHREVFRPDVEEIVDARIGSAIGSLRNEMLNHFDGVYKSLDRLETEYYALSAAVTRIENKYESLSAAVTRLENRLPN